jgi:histone deacetylase 8
VLVAGADGLAGDPLGGWSLSPAALAGAATAAAAWGAPLLVLGGGGYSDANAARAWAAVTAALAGAPVRESVPNHPHFLSYGPSFQMWDAQPLRPDENDRGEVLARCRQLVAALKAQYEEDDVADAAAEAPARHAEQPPALAAA